MFSCINLGLNALSEATERFSRSIPFPGGSECLVGATGSVALTSRRNPVARWLYVPSRWVSLWRHSPKTTLKLYLDA